MGSVVRMRARTSLTAPAGSVAVSGQDRFRYAPATEIDTAPCSLVPLLVLKTGQSMAE